MYQMKAVSLFSGCGGFDWGATQAGVEIIWANDIDKTASIAYKSIFPNTEFIFGDVRGIKNFPKADIMIGCYPCTGFSSAARRKWKKRGERDLTKINGNFLYLEFLRALKHVNPKYFFVENVEGMITAKNGWFFTQQFDGFRNMGYSVQYKTLEAISYGVPQTRKRVFIVGIRNDIAKEFTYIFPAQTHDIAGPHTCPNMFDTIGNMPEWPEGEFCTLPFHGHYLTRNRKRPWNTQSYTIVAHQSHVPLHPGGKPMKKIGKDLWELQGDFNRRLSWRECLLLQGLPKKMEIQAPLSCKYKVIGNAVPPAFGKALLSPVIAFEQGMYSP